MYTKALKQQPMKTYLMAMQQLFQRTNQQESPYSQIKEIGNITMLMGTISQNFLHLKILPMEPAFSTYLVKTKNLKPVSVI